MNTTQVNPWSWQDAFVEPDAHTLVVGILERPLPGPLQ